MGNNSSDTQEASQKKNAAFISSLKFYEDIITEDFGPIRIFKSSQKPFRYYMLYREVGINEEKTRLRLQEKMNWYINLKEHKNIVNIEHIDMQPTQDMCIQKISLDLYVKYYNYTLDMAVVSKLKRCLRFREGDLFYILMSLLSIGKEFNSMVGSQSCGWFNPKNIYITPEGHIKIYPFPLYCELKTIAGIQRSIESPPKHPKSFLENEELVLNLSRKTSDGTSSRLTVAKKVSQKEDLRDIGLLMFQLIILNRESVEVKLYSNEKICSILNKYQKQNLLSPHLKNFLLKLICNYKEMSYLELINFINILHQAKEIEISNSIKLDEGSSIVQSSIFEKNEQLKNLSQHKNLKAGCISVVSNHKKKVFQHQ